MTIDEFTGVMSKRIRRRYCAERNKWHLIREGRSVDWGGGYLIVWDGGYNQVSGITYSSVWERIAIFCFKEQLDAEAMVMQAFEQAYSIPPEPNFFLSANAKAIACEAARSSFGKLRMELNRQMHHAMTEIMCACSSRKCSAGEAIDISLCNKLLPFSDIFRFCYLRKCNRPTADQFALGARIDYVQDVNGYRAAWAEVLPDELCSGNLVGQSVQEEGISFPERGGRPIRPA